MQARSIFNFIYDWILRPLFALINRVLTIAMSVLRPAIWFVALVFLLVGSIALIADLTRAQSGGWHFRTTAEHIQAIAPATLGNLGTTISRLTAPWVWEVCVSSLLAIPAWLLFCVLGALLLFASRQRKSVNIFIN